MRAFRGRLLTTLRESAGAVIAFAVGMTIGFVAFAVAGECPSLAGGLGGLAASWTLFSTVIPQLGLGANTDHAAWRLSRIVTASALFSGGLSLLAEPDGSTSVWVFAGAVVGWLLAGLLAAVIGQKPSGND